MSSKLLKIIPFIFFEVYWAVPLSEHGYNILRNTMSILANTYFPTSLVLWGVDSQQWPFVPPPPVSSALLVQACLTTLYHVHGHE